MNLEPFIYLALFLLFMLFTVLARWLKGEIEERIEAQPPEPTEYEVPRVLPESKTRYSANSKTRTQPREDIKDHGREPGSQEPLPKRRGRTIHLGRLRETRRGIMWMTILGPCRALEPPDDNR